MNGPDSLLRSFGRHGAAARERVLLVDDEPEILVALSDLLEDEFEIVRATSAREALALIAERSDFAVVVSDQRMRDMTGDVFLAEARTMSDAAAILLTGYADLETVASALNRGSITFYAAKPWEPDGLRAMVREAAAACRTRRMLATEREILRSLFDNLPVGLAFKDEEGRFTRLNALAARALGRSQKECLGRREEDFTPSGVPVLGDRTSSGDSEAPELVARRDASGRPRWHRVTRVALGGGRAGSPSGEDGVSEISVLIDQDVTDLMEMERRLRQADKMQAIGTLAGGIAHDFNNLLTAILGSLELVSDLSPDLDARAARLFGNAMDAARRGATLTQKLLDFSRPRDLARQSVDVPKLLEQMQGLLTQSVGGGGKRMTPVHVASAPAGLPAASTDPALLEVALVNLCLNARDAQPNGGEILISTREAMVRAPEAGMGHASSNSAGSAAKGQEPPETQSGQPLAPGRYVIVTVSDRGVGMSPETQTRIFEPFFTTKAVGGGIGLGLSMIYGFMQRNQGGVRVNSAPGQGSSIELWLPAVEISSSGVRGDAAKDVNASSKRGGGRSVLVVDDDESVASVTSSFLSKAGFDVIECHSGAEAIDLTTQRPEIGLVVMDLLMPQMNGDECARRIAEIRHDLKILFVTGFADRARLPTGAKVIAKPFTRDALLSGIDAVLAG